MKFFRKYHKWLGIILTLFIILFSLSGIVLNHRSFFSPLQINRSILADDYKYQNWNNAAIKGSLKLSTDSILVYGNVGVWLCDSTFTHFEDFNTGFPKGIDNRKISKLYLSYDSQLLAGTLFGLYQYTPHGWVKKTIAETIRIVDITQKQDTVLLLSRSHLYKSTDLVHFSKHTFPEPTNYDNKVGLFKTLWTIHSGELFGLLGKLFVDLLGLVFLFISITGLIYFIAPKLIKKRKKQFKKVVQIVSLNRWSLKWHNKLGVIFVAFMIITTLTGMFLRPPLLIAIARAKVNKIPFTHLDSPNAWFDKLRRIIYHESHKQYVVATNEGIYFIDETLNNKVVPTQKRLPISVMGVNVFEQLNSSLFLFGSFEGLFAWNADTGKLYDYIERKPYSAPHTKGRPIGQHMVAGYTRDFGDAEIVFDYNLGAQALSGNIVFPKMPKEIVSQPMSLWNFALEVHTARIFNALIGSFYILLIPLSGLGILFVLISGFIVWWKTHRKTKSKKMVN